MNQTIEEKSKIANMIKFCFKILFVFVLSFVSKAHSQNSTWNDQARKDLIAIYQIINIQTPGAKDAANKQFQSWMRVGLRKALNLTEKVKDYNDYYQVLSYYTAGFHDEHIVLEANQNLISKPKLQWPGFFIHFQKGKFLVSSYGLQKYQNDLPPINSRLVECDNISPKKIMKENVLPFNGNPKLNADWIYYSPLLLTKSSNLLSYPKECTFNIEGKNKKYILKWENVPTALDPKFAAYSHWPKFNIQLMSNNIVWITLPSFNAELDKNLVFFNKLRKLAPSFKNNRLIVLDLRGNGGGNSALGTEILKGFFGTPYFDYVMNKKKPILTQWRVSEENLNVLKIKYLPNIEKTMGKNQLYRDFLHLVGDIQIALTTNKPFVAFKETDSKNQNVGIVVNPLKGKIVLITDGRCGSSCLTFIEQALNFPNVLLAGEPTHANSNYGEIRFEKLSSGYAKLGFPMTVTRYRKRLSNQPYIPNFIYPENINDSEKLKNWILTKFA